MDPITSGALAKGAARIGTFAIDWAKGPTAHRVAAGLGARLEERDFEIFNFKSLDNDERYWDFVAEFESTSAFDEARISEILRRHVVDQRGEKESAESIARVIVVMRALLPQVMKGGSPALGAASALQHQDHLDQMRELRELRESIQAVRSDAASTRVVIAVDRTWVSGRRAAAAWERLFERDPEAAASLREALGQEPTVETVRAYLASEASDAGAIWETVVHIADGFGDWELLRDVALRYADTDGADRARGLTWAAGAELQLGHTTEAEKLLAKAEKLDAQHPSIALVRARAVEDAEERVYLLRQIEPRDDDQRLALEGALAHAYQQLNDPDAAYAAIKRAREIDPDDLLVAEIEAALIVQEVISGKTTNWHAGEKALADLDRVRERLLAVGRFDLSAQIAGKIAQLHLLFGDSQKIKELADSLASDERRREELGLLAAAVLSVGEPADALALLPEKPESEYSRFVFASALMTTDKKKFLSDGIRILDELLDASDPQIQVEAAWIRAGAAHLDEPAPPSERASALLRERDPVRGLLIDADAATDPAEAERILESGGEVAELLIERGRIASRRGDWETALELYRRATTAMPTAINKLALAHALRESGDGEAAKALALEVARSDLNAPGIRDSAYTLAYGLTQRHGDVEAQIALAEEWSGTTEPSPRLLWSLVWSLVRVGRYADAKSVIERYELEPDDDDGAALFADVRAHTINAPEEQLPKLLELADRFDHEIPAIEFRIMMAALAVDDEKVDAEAFRRGTERVQTFPTRYPEGMVAVEIDPDDPLRHIQPMLEQRARAVQTVAKGVTTGDAPFAALAATTGRDIGSLTLAVNLLPLGFGSSDLDEFELEDARAALGKGAVIDSLAINVAGGLGDGIFKKIKLAFKTLAVPQAVVDDARLGAYDASSPIASATLGFDPEANRVYYQELDEAEQARAEHRAKAILQLLDGMTVEQNVVGGGSGPIEEAVHAQGDVERPALATAGATLAVAERTGSAVYSDDRFVRLHARRLGLPAFGTASLLAAMTEKGMITPEERTVAIELVLQTGAQGIPVDLFDPVAHARAAGWNLTFALRTFLLDNRRWNEEFDANLRRWLDFLRVVFDEAPERFGTWVFRVADAAILALSQNPPLAMLTAVALAATAGAQSETEPSFRAALLNELERIRFHYNVIPTVKSSVGRWVEASAQSSEAESDTSTDEAPGA
jgi:tetratricopeptide (TPR) repeat protein